MSADKGIQLTIPGERSADAYRPKAQRDQLVVEDWDHALIAMARASRPGVFWWYGYRTVDGKEQAVCYVCGKDMAKITSHGTVYRPAAERIMKHRASHHQDAVRWLARQLG